MKSGISALFLCLSFGAFAQGHGPGNTSVEECYTVNSISVRGVRSSELIVTLNGTENKILLQDVNEDTTQAALAYVIQTAAASGKEICGKFATRTVQNGNPISPDIKYVTNMRVRF